MQCECGKIDNYVDANSFKRGNANCCIKCIDRYRLADYSKCEKLYGVKAVSRCRVLWGGIKGRTAGIYKKHNIIVCDRWMDFESFVKDVIVLDGFDNYDLQLDRINNDGNYDPGNVKFSTAKQNTRNRRNTLFILNKGVKMPLTEFIETEFDDDMDRCIYRYFMAIKYVYTLDSIMAMDIVLNSHLRHRIKNIEKWTKIV